jgi:hypothetical protein
MFFYSDIIGCIAQITIAAKIETVLELTLCGMHQKKKSSVMFLQATTTECGGHEEAYGHIQRGDTF